jgi:protein TonB
LLSFGGHALAVGLLLWTAAPALMPAPGSQVVSVALIRNQPAPSPATSASLTRPEPPTPQPQAVQPARAVAAEPPPVPAEAADSEAASPAQPAEQVLVEPAYQADYLRNPAPVYPRISKRLGEQGEVILRVQVDAQGRPRQVDLHSSSGHARLDQAAMEVVQRWNFAPARRGPRAVEAWVRVPISFSLE